MSRCFPCFTYNREFSRAETIAIRVDSDMTNVTQLGESVECNTRRLRRILVILPVLSRARPENPKSNVVFEPKYWNPYKHQRAIVDAPKLLQLDGHPVPSSQPGPTRGVAEYMELLRMTRTNKDYEYKVSGSNPTPEHGEVGPPPEGLAEGVQSQAQREYRELRTPSDTHVSQMDDKDSDSKMSSMSESCSGKIEMINLVRPVQNSQSDSQSPKDKEDCEETAF